MEENSQYKIIFTKTADKDLKNIVKNKTFSKKVHDLLDILETRGPFATPPQFEPLKGCYQGMYSRRINRVDRLVYSVEKDLKQITIYSILSHYEKL